VSRTLADAKKWRLISAMKTFLVSFGSEAPSRTWGWLHAESAEQIHATFHSLTVHEPPPDWATPSMKEDFGVYSLAGPTDPWLENLRLRPSPILSAILRITDVKIGKNDLDRSLQISSERFESVGKYAQLDIPVASGWRSIDDYMKALVPRIHALKTERKIGHCIVDVAISFMEGNASLSVEVPRRITEVLNQYDIGLELSIYRTSEPSVG
jgi:hypothetical protein